MARAQGMGGGLLAWKVGEFLLGLLGQFWDPPSRLALGPSCKSWSDGARFESRPLACQDLREAMGRHCARTDRKVNNWP